MTLREAKLVQQIRDLLMVMRIEKTTIGDGEIYRTTGISGDTAERELMDIVVGCQGY